MFRAHNQNTVSSGDVKNMNKAKPVTESSKMSFHAMDLQAAHVTTVTVKFLSALNSVCTRPLIQ